MEVAFWFRRDLRLHDNHGLFEALNSGHPVRCHFIFDTHILEDLHSTLGYDGSEPVLDKRLVFIHERLEQIREKLQKMNSCLEVHYGQPVEIWKSMAGSGKIAAVYLNRDYEPYARQRDSAVRDLLNDSGIEMLEYKDQVIFEKDEVLKDDGDPYKVFTPYSRKWKTRLEEEGVPAYPSEKLSDKFVTADAGGSISLTDMGFAEEEVDFPGAGISPDLLSAYSKTRDYPSKAGTSRLGVHLRFGTVSIRELVRLALKHNASTYLNELIWREFYMMILWHFPDVVEGSFHRKYDAIEWRNDEAEFEKWCSGQTGYPIVDAGMRELKATGYMHNRVRMITASFLTKHLLIDWRWGEAWFARYLLDFELASNNGGWQWAAGTGCDAAPYFRIFNPASQTKKFDNDREYIRKWVPELDSEDYPDRMVDHKFARQRALDTYKAALDQAG